MSPTKPIVAVTYAVLALAVISSTVDSRHSGVVDDQVVASFERDFNHETVSEAATTRVAIDSDELYELVNKPLQTADEDVWGDL
jgi:hypothetical protein